MKLPFLSSAASLDFLAIGDTVVDDFVRLKDAKVSCNIDTDACEISMRWGDKIPFESSTKIVGVGNSANASSAAARLGLQSGLITNIGKDGYGDEIVAALKGNGIDTRYVLQHAGKTSNYHYVLWFESERTILVKHEVYDYVFPKDLPKVKTLYLSSLGEIPDSYYESIASYVEANPDIRLVFQPGTFQMAMGTERLARIYKRADVFFCNKEEAERILKLPSGQTVESLLEGVRALGPKVAIITDGRDGAYAFDGTRKMFVPMYPDTREPFERTGAGDSFASTVTCALTLGKPLEEALLWGPINSMSVVQQVGGQRGLLPRPELERYLAEAPEEYRIRDL